MWFSSESSGYYVSHAPHPLLPPPSVSLSPLPRPFILSLQPLFLASVSLDFIHLPSPSPSVCLLLLLLFLVLRSILQSVLGQALARGRDSVADGEADDEACSISKGPLITTALLIGFRTRSPEGEEAADGSRYGA